MNALRPEEGSVFTVLATAWLLVLFFTHRTVLWHAVLEKEFLLIVGLLGVYNTMILA